MTARELINVADGYSVLLGAAFVLPPILTWIFGRLHGKDRGSLAPWKYLYSILVYAVCVPGMAACILTAYTLFFSRENLLDVNLLIYFGPIASMVATLILIRKRVSFDDVPGFDRLSGLMVMIACTFGIVLAIHKTQIWIFFGGSIERLFALAVGVFALLKWGTYMLFRSRDEPKQQMPDLPMK